MLGGVAAVIGVVLVAVVIVALVKHQDPGPGCGSTAYRATTTQRLILRPDRTAADIDAVYQFAGEAERGKCPDGERVEDWVYFYLEKTNKEQLCFALNLRQGECYLMDLSEKTMNHEACVHARRPGKFDDWRAKGARAHRWRGGREPLPDRHHPLGLHRPCQALLPGEGRWRPAVVLLNTRAVTRAARVAKNAVRHGILGVGRRTGARHAVALIGEPYRGDGTAVVTTNLLGASREARNKFSHNAISRRGGRPATGKATGAPRFGGWPAGCRRWHRRSTGGPLQAVGTGIDNTQVGLLVTVSTGVGALATLVAGPLADRIVRVRLLWATLLVCSAAMALSAVSPSYSWLLACRVALGAGVAVSGPVVASLIGDYFAPGERGRVYSLLLAGAGACTAVGLLVSGQLGAVSWRLGFWWLALVGLAVAVAVATMLREPVHGGGARAPMPQCGRTPSVAACFEKCAMCSRFAPMSFL